MTPTPGTWRSIYDDVLARINSRDWVPGELIPPETDLAGHYGCSRATVNKALQALAEDGFVERRRRAGTRVALRPVSRAIFDIPIIRQEITGRGHAYGYRLLEHNLTVDTIRLKALHLADGAPYVLEIREINLTTIPAARSADFARESANEWLLQHAPYTHGKMVLTANQAEPESAGLLGCQPGDALLTIERTTFDGPRQITHVRLVYGLGHQLSTAVGPRTSTS